MRHFPLEGLPRALDLVQSSSFPRDRHGAMAPAVRRELKTPRVERAISSQEMMGRPASDPRRPPIRIADSIGHEEDRRAEPSAARIGAPTVPLSHSRHRK